MSNRREQAHNLLRRRDVRRYAENAHQRVAAGDTVEEIAAHWKLEPRLLRRLMNKHPAKVKPPVDPATTETKETEMSRESITTGDIRIGVTDTDVRVMVPSNNPYFEFHEQGLFIEFDTTVEGHFANIHIGHEKSRRGGVQSRGGRKDSNSEFQDWLVTIAPKFVPGANKLPQFGVIPTEFVSVDDMTVRVKLPDALPPFKKFGPKRGHHNGGNHKSPLYIEKRAGKAAPTAPAPEVAASAVAAPAPVSAAPSPALATDPQREAIAAALRTLNSEREAGSLRLVIDDHGALHAYRRFYTEEEVK